MPRTYIAFRTSLRKLFTLIPVSAMVVGARGTMEPGAFWCR